MKSSQPFDQENPRLISSIEMLRNSKKLSVARSFILRKEEGLPESMAKTSYHLDFPTRLALKDSAIALKISSLGKEETKNVLFASDINPEMTGGKLQNLSKALDHMFKFSADCQLVYRSYTGHNVLIALKVKDGQKFFVIFDSLGNDSLDVDIIFPEIHNVAKSHEESAETFVLAGAEKRQSDFDSCSIFVYKDLKEILRSDDLLDTIIGLKGKGLKSCKDSDVINFFEKFPAQLLKLTQKVHSMVKPGKFDERLGDEVDEKKLIDKLNKYLNAKPLLDKDGNVIKNLILNYAAKVFKAKYIEELERDVPKMKLEDLLENLEGFHYTSHIESLAVIENIKTLGGIIDDLEIWMVE